MADITTFSFFINESEDHVPAFATHEQYRDSKQWTGWMYEIPPQGKLWAAKFDTGTNRETDMRFTVIQSIRPMKSVQTKLNRKLKKGDAIYAVYTSERHLDVYIKPRPSPDISLETLNDPSLWELSPDQKVN